MAAAMLQSTICLAAVSLSLSPTPITPAFVAPSIRRAPPPAAKFMEAALASAFATKDEPKPEEELSLAEMEANVIDSIREGLDAVGKPRRAWDALGDFGKASGALAATWLTPQQVEKVVAFWGCGGTLIARDLRRGGLPRLQDLQSSGLFSLIAINTFPWTPLLLPLVARAEGVRPGFVPPAFDENRLAAVRRLRGDTGLSESIDTPQTIDEGVAFFRDGSQMLLRDFRRKRLTAYGDKLSSYAWFLFLTFSTFPLTPLLLPVIDKRREGTQSDYVPASFRAPPRRVCASQEERAGGHKGACRGDCGRRHWSPRRAARAGGAPRGHRRPAQLAGGSRALSGRPRRRRLPWTQVATPVLCR